jgi:hypothetical protein
LNQKQWDLLTIWYEIRDEISLIESSRNSVGFGIKNQAHRSKQVSNITIKTPEGSPKR